MGILNTVACGVKARLKELGYCGKVIVSPKTLNQNSFCEDIPNKSSILVKVLSKPLRF